MSELENPTKYHEMTHRPHSYRSHEPEDYREIIEESGKAKCRQAMQRIEGGRFTPMLKATHKMYAALDPDERKAFWQANTDLMKWASVWGFSEDLIDFEKEEDYHK